MSLRYALSGYSLSAIGLLCPKMAPTESGWGFSHSRGPQLATFTAPTPLTRQICHALAVLRQARSDGNADRITLAAARLDRLLDRYPR